MSWTKRVIVIVLLIANVIYLNYSPVRLGHWFEIAFSVFLIAFILIERKHVDKLLGKNQSGSLNAGSRSTNMPSNSKG